MIRYLVLANAGGVVAVLTFLGTLSNANHGSLFVLVPLGLFFTGMVFAGIGAIGLAGQQLFNAVLATDRLLQTQTEITKSAKWVMALRHASAGAELFAFVFFNCRRPFRSRVPRHTPDSFGRHGPAAVIARR